MARPPDAATVHATIGRGGWPDVLRNLGVDADCLRNRHQPCPLCGGKDRFRFDDKNGRGDWFCNQCRAGDGFKLLMGVNGWSFVEALRAVANYLGLTDGTQPDRRPAPQPERQAPQRAELTARVRDLLRTACRCEDVPDVVAYLRSRNVWPLPEGSALRAHVAVDYRELLTEGGKAYQHVARLPAIVAPMVDQGGEAVTAHLTYLEHGAKFARTRLDGTAYAPRKILSPLTGRIGIHCRVTPIAGDVLGVAEGIETALSASRMNGDVPTVACLNTALLAKFVPPAEVRTLIVFADRDADGMEAAWKLRDEMEGRCNVELRLPPARANDWNDAARGKTH